MLEGCRENSLSEGGLGRLVVAGVVVPGSW